MLDQFRVIPFIVAFVIGLFTITWRKPDGDQRIIRWPHPKTCEKTTYRDRNGLCYKYKVEEVKCDASAKPYPHE